MMVILVTANNYLLMFVGLFSAVYNFKFINYYSTICWETLTFCLRAISRKPYFYTLRDPQRLYVGYPTMYIKNVYRGKNIVQGLLKNYYSYLLNLLTIYTHYSYYNSYLYYFYYLNLNVYSLSVFKRFYSKIVETSKFSKQYKKEYELTQEQKESIIGIPRPRLRLAKSYSDLRPIQLRFMHTKCANKPDKLKSDLKSLHTLYIKNLYQNRIAPVKPFDRKLLATCTNFLDKALKDPFLQEWGSKSGIYLIEYKHDPSIFYIGRSSLFKKRFYDHFKAHSLNKFHLFLRLVG